MTYTCRWKDDNGLRIDVHNYVKQSMKRSEILEFVKRDYPDYAWSIPTDGVWMFGHIFKKYVEFLYEAGVVPNYLRIEKGTETRKMATIHAYLIDKLGVMENATEYVVFGPSTTNKIERWWRDLRERLEKCFKAQPSSLLQSKKYDPHDEVHRQLPFYVFKPVIQQECEQFVENWNCHRIRRQKIELPTGIPDHLFAFRESYGGRKCGTNVTPDGLREVAEMSGVLKAPPDISDQRLEQKCMQIIPNPELIEPHRLKDMYCFLKQQYLSQNIT
eukprot:gene13130-14481_t